MAKRKLRVVRRTNNYVLGICEFCNTQFPAHEPFSGQPEAQADIQQQFDAHKCKLIDSSQNALRIVREATEDK
jgi:hypothetical protein